MIRWFNRARHALRTPYVVLGAILVAALAYLVVMPFWEVLATSFQAQRSDLRRIPGAEVGDFTLYYWERMLNSPLTERGFLQPLFNTLTVSLLYTVLAMAIGVGLAWLTARTDMAYRRAIPDLILVPYVIPSWGIALAWITLFRSDTMPGHPAGVLQAFTGITVPTWVVFGPFPIIIVLAINYFAFTYLLAASAFASIDASLEDAGRLHGASRWRILRRITLPITLPALGSAFILTFSQGLGTFGVPAFLGMPDRYFVLATSLFFNINTGRIGDAFVLAIFIIGLASITIYINTLVLGRRRQFTTISGKGVRPLLTPLGRWRVPIGVGTIAFLLLIAAVPLVVLVMQTLTWRVGNFSLEHFTLHFWFGREMVGAQFQDRLAGIFYNPEIMRASWNSIRLGVIVGLVVALTGQLAGYVISRGRGGWIARILEQLTFLPFVIPSVVFGAIYLTLFAQPRGPIPALYGTFALLVVVSVVKRLPFAARSGTSSMMQVSGELEEAARMHRAGFLRILTRILFPLTRNGIFVGFIFGFVNTVKDLALVILLVTPLTNVLPALTYSYTERGFRQYSDAVTVLIVIIVLVGTFLARRISRTDFSRGF